MTPLDQAPGIIGTLVAVAAAMGGWRGVVAIRGRNGNGAAAKLVELRHERVMGALGGLETAITDLSEAVTALRIEVAKRD